MHHFERRLTLPVPRQQLFAWHERPGAFERLAPSWEDLEIVARHGGIHDGARLHFRMRQGPFAVDWIARHQGYAPPQRFEDVAERSPFSTWHHVHRFEAVDDEHSTLIDGVDYELPFAAIADPLVGATVERMLERMFRQRHLRTTNDLRRHLAYADRPPLRIAVA
ncbi:MAG: SRPBCC family protein, partial [Myxococcales bacterium]|nr:SRPBCC family protein [Myxococcales bacterium]